jgi:hypothetical protein
VKSTPPTIEPDDQHGKKISHPSYGVVKIHRVSGTTELFDSAFKHQYFISLEVCKAAKYTDGTHDFIHEDYAEGGHRQLLEVWMSETQFAQAITSMNLGSGSPCTIVRHGGKGIPLPEKEDLQKSHKEMVREKLEGKVESFKALADRVRKMREEKKRPTLKDLDQLVHDLDCMVGNFEGNMEYYAGCFEEHMEKTVAAAKSEIEVHLLSSAERLGINRDQVPQLETDDDGGPLRLAKPQG